MKLFRKTGLLKVGFILVVQVVDHLRSGNMTKNRSIRDGNIVVNQTACKQAVFPHKLTLNLEVKTTIDVMS